MKKKHVFPFLFLLSVCLTSCGYDGLSYDEVDLDALQKQNVTDNYRSFYQIFPTSFADGNGDGKGDLRGIIDKLDYLKDLHYTGIWLNPIHPSDTYHHYDVQDYYKIAPQFGTMADFDELVSKVHEKGMTIILDLVINHSSNKNEWFENSYLSAMGGLRDADYYRYNWVACTGNAPTGYHKVKSTDKVAYESRFDAAMPDFNLQQVLDDPESSDLAVEFRKIFSFWLTDHNVDGFRMDAVTSFFTGNQGKNRDMLAWINQECKAIKPNCYLVGEASWGSNAIENKEYQESGVDSFFQFANSAKNSGYLTTTTLNQDATKLATAILANEDNANGGIPAPMLGNHDLPRYVATVYRSRRENVKFTYGLLQQLAGATFTYYGDEMGMASPSITPDQAFRLPVRWGDSYTCEPAKALSGYSKFDESLAYPYPTVAEQLNDPDSIVNYAKKANTFRIRFPEISHGTAEQVYRDPNSKSFAIVKRTYKGSSVYVAVNASSSKSFTLDYSNYGTKVEAELCALGHVKSLGGTSIEIPNRSIVVIR